MKLPAYNDNPSAYYAVLATLTKEELKKEWQPITEERADYLLDCVPPARMKNGAFMVGECMTHSPAGAIYEAVANVENKYFARPAPISDFDPEAYKNEVRELN